MKAASLSARARRSLDDIGAYSVKNFGDRRGDAYVASLLARCRAVARGTEPHHACRDFFAEDLRDNLRFARAGQHFVIFVETPRDIVIIDFLHQSADIGNRLGDPPP